MFGQVKNEMPFQIARKFGFEVDVLVHANRERYPTLLSSTKLSTGDLIILPARLIAEYRADLWLGWSKPERKSTGQEIKGPSLGGIHMFTRKRNCKLFERFSFQLTAASTVGSRLRGVLEADFLRMNRSKTDYDVNDKLFNLTRKAIADAMHEYYYKVQNFRTAGFSKSQKKSNSATSKVSITITVGFKDRRMLHGDVQPRLPQGALPAGIAGASASTDGAESIPPSQTQTQIQTGREERPRRACAPPPAADAEYGEYAKIDPEYGLSTTRCWCQMQPGGFMIECTICKKWVHGTCYGYLNAQETPENLQCEHCIQKYKATDNEDMAAQVRPRPRHRLTSPGAHTTCTQSDGF